MRKRKKATSGAQKDKPDDEDDSLRELEEEGADIDDGAFETEDDLQDEADDDDDFEGGEPELELAEVPAKY